MANLLKQWLKQAILTLLLVVGLWGWGLMPASAQVLIGSLPAGNAITSGKALLRYALPIDNKPVRQLQKVLEDISTPLRTRKRLSAINSSLTQAERILTNKQDALFASVPEDRRAEAGFLMTQLQMGINDMRSAVENDDKDAVWKKRSELLDMVGILEELMVPAFPYEVPEEYSNLPQLKGRATVEVLTTKGRVVLVADGYSAPVTAGNFVDLVNRGFYNGLPFTRAEDFYVVQVGDPPGDAEGFIDPKTKEYRAIPLEVRVKGDDVPTYGITLEDAGRFLEEPVLPFSAYGTVAMARPGDDVNGGSSQFFFFLFEPELTPAGANLLDGRYSVFGYVIEGEEVLGKLKPGDKIDSAKVLNGMENLVEPA
ncbi:MULTISPECIES: peptidylprolyl isomerase [unclassified Leptolyngbya]|uniref:peptidylprolyl isomerase n=1 Tax=unclassified Leptolyngbya TaxID=2650499 RepID=UPI00168226A5|nr:MULTISPECIES: peptidylprolyl isomerase [unclassified Leptolyngbya]MBD1912219.1 peptidylprolyl isomerase [Leptolyngbya sp. FACHB-8]MBD2155110.1 peptidylprolyl isomerase [Leptolyngbya sp. FACHB-16]